MGCLAPIGRPAMTRIVCGSLPICDNRAYQEQGCSRGLSRNVNWCRPGIEPPCPPTPDPTYAPPMRILFLEFDTEHDWAVASLGPAFLAAFLRQHAHEAAFLRVPVDRAIAWSIAADVRAKSPDLIGVSLTTRQWLRGRDVLAALRRTSNIPVIVGGLHATFSPEDVLHHDGIDYLCLGEGEAALLDLVTALESGQPATGIPNIWVKHQPRPRLRQSDRTARCHEFLARDMLDERWGVRHISARLSVPLHLLRRARQRQALQMATPPTMAAAALWPTCLPNCTPYATPVRSTTSSSSTTFTIHSRRVREFCKVYAKEFNISGYP